MQIVSVAPPSLLNRPAFFRYNEVEQIELMGLKEFQGHRGPNKGRERKAQSSIFRKDGCYSSFRRSLLYIYPIEVWLNNKDMLEVLGSILESIKMFLPSLFS